MDTAVVNAIFIVSSVIVVVGLVSWLLIFARRAARLSRASDIRLATDIASLAPPATDDKPQVPASDTGSSIAWDTLPWSEPQSASRPPAAQPAADSIEGRLAELSELHARKLISDDELAAARAKVLAE
jgi:hypothetical protein